MEHQASDTKGLEIAFKAVTIESASNTGDKVEDKEMSGEGVRMCRWSAR